MRPEHVRRALRAPGLNPTERVVLVALADYAQDSDGRAWPSRKRLCAELELGQRTIGRALAHLIELGYVSEAAPAQPGRTRELLMHTHTWGSPEPPG